MIRFGRVNVEVTSADDLIIRGIDARGRVTIFVLQAQGMGPDSGITCCRPLQQKLLDHRWGPTRPLGAGVR